MLVSMKLSAKCANLLVKVVGNLSEVKIVWRRHS